MRAACDRLEIDAAYTATPGGISFGAFDAPRKRIGYARA